MTDKWFIVAGHIGDQLESTTAKFYPVEAESVDDAMKIVQDNVPEFTAKTAISENQLKYHIEMIENAKEKSAGTS